jgi:hypothetical protein
MGRKLEGPKLVLRHGKIYSVRFGLNRKRHEISTRCRDRVAAREIATIIYKEVMEREGGSR